MKKWVLILVLALLLAGCSGEPPFDELTFGPGYKSVTNTSGEKWDVTFEFAVNSTFSGTVRHKSLWYDPAWPFMSHDLLVTTGDFAKSDLVYTLVAGHKFFYRYSGTKPNGTIHLLHIFPASKEIFDQLQQILKWDTVTITGQEIFKIDKYDEKGKYLGYFEDTGCNSILVTSVSIIPK